MKLTVTALGAALVLLSVVARIRPSRRRASWCRHRRSRTGRARQQPARRVRVAGVGTSAPVSQHLYQPLPPVRFDDRLQPRRRVILCPVAGRDARHVRGRVDHPPVGTSAAPVRLAGPPLAAALHVVGDIGAVVVRGPGPLAERPDLIPRAAPGDPDPEANTSDRYRTLTRLPAYLDRGRRVRDCQIPASASGSR